MSPQAFANVDPQLEGFSQIKAKNFSKALECFNIALKEHPNSWLLMQSAGNCHMELGQYDKAIAILQKSIEVGGLHASQCKNMAAVYQRLGQPKKALSWLKLACSVDPTQAADLNVQAAITKLQNPANNPIGSLTASDYSSSLVSFKGWHKESMPLKVYVRKNIQIPDFYNEFVSLIRESFEQWSAATGSTVSYRFVDSPDGANVLCDYTDRRELVSSQHELGIDGITEMLVKQDNTPGSANVVVLVKDGPGLPTFKKRALLSRSCLHEVGHALGMHGHSPNNHDVMFTAATLNGPTQLSERDKNTIRRIYRYLTATRAYSPVLGRFISRDPIEESGGVNLYTYVKNDPINFADPSGEKAQSSRCVECPYCDNPYGIGIPKYCTEETRTTPAPGGGTTTYTTTYFTMNGHSPNNHDVMFSAATLNGPTRLSERDKNTIQRIYKR